MHAQALHSVIPCHKISCECYKIYALRHLGFEIHVTIKWVNTLIR
jgi:hypothetical protein